MKTHALYAQEELDRARIAQKRVGTAMAIVAGLGLILCVLFCIFATRQNQQITRPLTIGASVLSGWIVIFLSHSRYDGARAKVRHLELMLTGPRERYTGRFVQQEGVYRVKKGVSIRKVSLREDFHEILLSVYDEKAAQLPTEFEGTVETVYDCIVAWTPAGARSTSGEASASREVPA